MEKSDALDAFSALSQQTRLDVFLLLVRCEPVGLPAGEIAARLGVPPNTLSSHLAILSRAGLALAERQGRSIIYRAAIGRVQALTRFLVERCCDGRPDRCVDDACVTAPGAAKGP